MERWTRRIGICVIGAGVLGSSFLQKIAGSGFREINVVDGDIVDKRNLHNQSIYRKADADGKVNKAVAACYNIRERSGNTILRSFPFYVGERRINSVISGSDVIIDLTDNIESRLVINRAVVRSGKKALFASVNQKQGFVYVKNGNSACFQCIYRNARVKDAARCVSVASEKADKVSEILKRELSNLVSKGGNGSLVQVSFSNGSMSNTPLKKDPDCEVCGKNQKGQILQYRFSQLCGNGFKFSLERNIDIDRLSRGFKGFKSRNFDGEIILSKGKKSIIASRYGDFLLSGFSPASAKAMASLLQKLFYRGG